jgi:peptidoglycan/LPS O-acetylase OafA/YrhL
MWVPALHGIRGIAALLVLVLHAYWTWPAAFSPAVRHLYLSVDLFFILSGFVICLRYEAFFQEGSIRAFMRKRFDRLAPVYYVTGLFWLVAFTALYASKGDGLSWEQTGISILRYGLALDIFETDGAAKLNPVAWSIMVEMFAYLLFALVFSTVRSLQMRLASVALMGAAALSWLVLNERDLNLVAGAGALVRCFAGFFIGVLICLLRQADMEIWLGLLAGVMCIAAGVLAWLHAGIDFVVFCLLVLAMLAVVQWSDRLPPLPRLFGWLGDISFSLYLWHFVISVVTAKLLMHLPGAAGHVLHDGEKFLALPLMTGLLALVAYVLVSMGVAHMSYRLIEQKFPRRRKRADGARNGIAAAQSESVPNLSGTP